MCSHIHGVHMCSIISGCRMNIMLQWQHSSGSVGDSFAVSSILNLVTSVISSKLYCLVIHSYHMSNHNIFFYYYENFLPNDILFLGYVFVKEHDIFYLFFSVKTIQ